MFEVVSLSKLTFFINYLCLLHSNRFKNKIVFWVSEIAFVMTSVKYVVAMLRLSVPEENTNAQQRSDAVGSFLILADVFSFSMFFCGGVLCVVWFTLVVSTHDNDSDVSAKDISNMKVTPVSNLTSGLQHGALENNSVVNGPELTFEQGLDAKGGKDGHFHAKTKTKQGNRRVVASEKSGKESLELSVGKGLYHNKVSTNVAQLGQHLVAKGGEDGQFDAKTKTTTEKKKQQNQYM